MDLGPLLFGGWTSLARIALVGVPIYALLLVLLHLSGKHALAKSNAYGLVVTVALGSALASSVLTRQVTLVDGVAAIALLLGLQYAMSFSVSRWEWAHRRFTQRAVLLVRDGELLRAPMRRERVTEAEVLAAVRKHGLGALSQVGAVVMETDGTLSVVARPGPDASLLEDVETPGEPRR